jgi:hydrogenase maturation protease
MKRILIAGIGNVLLGDDGVGPYVVRLLESSYSFAEGVEVQDLGTPALDFIDHIAGLDALIVIDSVENRQAPGTITLYRKEDLARYKPSIRMDTHSPAITESLLAAEVFFGISPKDILLIGISGGCYDAGCILSAPVTRALAPAMQAVLAELDRLSVAHQTKAAANSGIWWSAQPAQLA